MTPLVAWTLWCWLAFAIVWLGMWYFAKPAQWEQPVGDKAGYGVLLWFAFVFVFVSFRIPPPFGMTPMLPHTAPFVWLGFVLTLCGVVTAVWARASLGRNWSRTMDLKQDHTLITSGPYRVVRHPIYSGLLAMFAGTALVLGTPLVVVAVFLALWSCLIRIPAEEALMLRTFPNSYARYASHTRRLVPFVW